MTKPKSDVPMGMPEDKSKLPRVGGTTYEEREDFEYARAVADPTDPTKGDEPGLIVRAGQK